MSHQVTVDFEGITIAIQSQCETAAHSLYKIDKVLNRIHETASKLETEKVREYEVYLLDSKKKIQTLIDKYVASLEKYKELKKVSISADYSSSNNYNKMYQELTGRIKEEGNELIRTVNELTGSKLAMIDQMINEGLLNAGAAITEKMRSELSGVISVSIADLDKVNKIEDISLRELVYVELVNKDNASLSFEQIVSKAQKQYDVLLGKKTAEVVEEIKEELKTGGVSSEVIEKAKTIDEATQIANEAITDEKVRKETLKIIIKAIKERGFIVDTKNNLKIDREKNVVRLVALKASGQTAEFEIQLNGKFMYHFEGYEGLACNKDITPFIEDLKNVYDINILHEEVQWSNPDKISTQKYQYINKNKGTN